MAAGTVHSVVGRVVDAFRRRPPLLVDGLLAAAVFAVLVTGAVITRANDEGPPLRALGVVLLAVEAVPLIWRRRWPVPVSALTGAGAAGYGMAELPDPLLHVGLLVGLFTVAAHASRRATVAVAVAAAGVGLVAVAGAGDSGPDDYFVGFLPGVVALVLGDRQRTRAAYLAEVEQRAARRQREQEAEAARAVAEERARIAREMHDVVAHHVSMIVVQAEAGAATTPGSADTFEAIGATGRRALGELRRLLGVLRDDEEGSAAVAPQPGVARLHQLLAEVRAAGLPLDLRVEGEPRDLSDGVDVSAYRIVQEALTNVVKHAGASPTTVVLRYGPEALEVEVSNEGGDPGGPPAPSPASGRGLVGVRERVAMVHGHLRAGGRPDGGYELVARLPIDP